MLSAFVRQNCGQKSVFEDVLAGSNAFCAVFAASPWTTWGLSDQKMLQDVQNTLTKSAFLWCCARESSPGCWAGLDRWEEGRQGKLPCQSLFPSCGFQVSTITERLMGMAPGLST